MENNKCFLSVVIPLYNVEKYLESCLDSVLAAAIEDMEIVLIDDGSKDSSPAICDRYAAAHDHIRVIHQQNQGISVTRNIGIENACGEYIFFLDSDDRVHEDIFRKFAQFINDREYRPDMVLCNAEFVHIFNDKRVPMTLRADPSKIENVSGEQAVREILRTEPSFEWYCWRYFYRRHYILDAGHRFLVGRYYEDVKWTSQVLAQAKSVCYLPALAVHYTWCRPDSIVNSVSLKKATDKLFICEDTCRFATERISDPETSRLMLTNHSELYMSAFRDYCSGLKELYPYLKEYSWLLMHCRSKTGMLLHKTAKVLGFRIGSIITGFAFKILR